MLRPPSALASVRPPGVPLGAGWRWGQAISVALAAGLVVLLVRRPDLGLPLAWSVLVPLVPATLLFAPQVWRNLCPIGVVNQVPMRLGLGGTRRLSARVQRRAPLVAIGLFYLLVPLRLTLLNGSGPALAAFLVAVLAVAAVGGVLVIGKGGWCATICPVLPVERLYGQGPILNAPHAHCAACTGCIRSCYDLKPERSLDELVRGREGATGVLRRPMGVFAVAFPGFVLGYFTAGSGAAEAGLGPLAVYGWVLVYAAASAVLGGAVQWLAGASDRLVVRAAAALAVGLYYWFTVPAMGMAARDLLSLPVGVGAEWGLRAAFLGLAAVWFIRAGHPPLAARTVRRPPTPA